MVPEVQTLASSSLPPLSTVSQTSAAAPVEPVGDGAVVPVLPPPELPQAERARTAPALTATRRLTFVKRMALPVPRVSNEDVRAGYTRTPRIGGVAAEPLYDRAFRRVGRPRQAWPLMFTIQPMPNWSVHMPNSSPHICFSSGTVTVPAAASFSQ